MIQIGPVLTSWQPALTGSISNPMLVYSSRNTRIIRLGNNLLAINLYMVVQTGWTAGSGNVQITPPSNISGGFNPVAGNGSTQAMSGMCLVNGGSIIADKFYFDNSNNIIPCLSNGNPLQWSSLTSTGSQIQITFNYLVHI